MDRRITGVDVVWILEVIAIVAFDEHVERGDLVRIHWIERYAVDPPVQRQRQAVGVEVGILIVAGVGIANRRRGVLVVRDILDANELEGARLVRRRLQRFLIGIVVLVDWGEGAGQIGALLDISRVRT